MKYITKKRKRNLRIAVAKDEAFCFLYEDNLDYLRQSGCELTYFSPLKDSILPENIDGLLLYGGYPELHAEELSENISMREDIAGRIQSGLPCITRSVAVFYICMSILKLRIKKNIQWREFSEGQGIMPGNYSVSGT